MPKKQSAKVRDMSLYFSNTVKVYAKSYPKNFFDKKVNKKE